MFPEDLVHNIVKSNHEALPCDLRDPFPRDEGLHTEFARKIDGTVEDAVPEDLDHSILKSKGEALPCDLMEPTLREEGLRTGVVRVVGGTEQIKEPENTVHSSAKFYGESWQWSLMEPISRVDGFHSKGARTIEGPLRSAVPGDLGHRAVKFKCEHICVAAQCNLVQPGGPANLYGRQPAWPAGQQQALLERLRAYEAACRAARKKTAAPQEQPGVSFNLQPRANLVKGDGELQDKAPP